MDDAREMRAQRKSRWCHGCLLRMMARRERVQRQRACSSSGDERETAMDSCDERSVCEPLWRQYAFAGMTTFNMQGRPRYTSEPIPFAPGADLHLSCFLADSQWKAKNSFRAVSDPSAANILSSLQCSVIIRRLAGHPTFLGLPTFICSLFRRYRL